MSELITLHGTQNGSLFVDDLGREYRIINEWVCLKYEIEKYVQLIKYDDKAWLSIRHLDICRRKLN